MTAVTLQPNRAHRRWAGRLQRFAAAGTLSLAVFVAACSGGAEPASIPAEDATATADLPREELVALDAARADILVVTAVDGGYEPSEVIVRAGEPVIIQFVNRTDRSGTSM
jgi:chemotaxis methyl-accepting protein methylase